MIKLDMNNYAIPNMTKEDSNAIFNCLHTLCDTYGSNQCLMVERVYRAFNAHNEELDRLRKFEKKVRKLQDKCNKYGEKSSDYYLSDSDKSIAYEMKYDEALEEFLYL